MNQLIQAINNVINNVDDVNNFEETPVTVIYNLIRDTLDLNKNVEVLRSGDAFHISNSRPGLSFNMSGYDSKKAGDCHKYNQYILSLFSDLDLARNMKLMYLDFYKGIGTFQYIYWNDDKLQEVSLAGYTTTEIIYTLIKICIIDNPASRRRESKSLYASNN
jgi:hypothetical protein